MRDVGFGTLKRDLVARESQLKTMRQGRLINIIISRIVPVDGGSGLLVGLDRARIRVSWESDPKPLHDVTLPLRDMTLYQTPLPLILDGTFLRVNRSTHLQLRFYVDLYVGQDPQGAYISSPISITSPDGLLLPIADIAHMRDRNGALCFNLALESNISLDPAAFPLEPLSNRVIPRRPRILSLFYIFKDVNGNVTQKKIVDGWKCGLCGLEEDVGDLNDMSELTVHIKHYHKYECAVLISGTGVEMVITLPDCIISAKRHDASQVFSSIAGDLMDQTGQISTHTGGMPSYLPCTLQQLPSGQDSPVSFESHLPPLASESNNLEITRSSDHGTLGEVTYTASYTDDIASSNEFTKPAQPTTLAIPGQLPSSQVSGSSSEPLRKSSTVTRSPSLSANLAQSPPPALGTQDAQIEKITSFPIPLAETALSSFDALRVGSPLPPAAGNCTSAESSDSTACPLSSLPSAPLSPRPTHQSNGAISSSTSSQKASLVYEPPSLASVLKTSANLSMVESSEGRPAASTSLQSACTNTEDQCLGTPGDAFMSQVNGQPMSPGPCQSQLAIAHRFSALEESGFRSPSCQQLDDHSLRQLFTPELEDVRLLSDSENDVPRYGRTESPSIGPITASVWQMPAPSPYMSASHADFQEPCILSGSMIPGQSLEPILSSSTRNEKVPLQEGTISLAGTSEPVSDSKSTDAKVTLTFINGKRASHFDDSSDDHNVTILVKPETSMSAHSRQSPTNISGHSHSQLRDTPPAIEHLRPFTKTGHAGPYMGKRVNQWTEWSSSLEPGTLIDFMGELDKVWDGGQVRHLIRHQEPLMDSP
ncbi:hypothetical protein C367_02708 [Cryptococcus neoformans Ze90-1]|nr:hypothetical protein C367_02708 [Cryptococcus neoformans var. grubii Ze90-1]